MGSIQAAIKKLLSSEMITFEEYIENSVNKKVYSITNLGREEFISWINTPMNAGKTKNMELSKLFFMGLSSKTKRVELIEKYINQLKEELAYLETIKLSINNIREEIKLYSLELDEDNIKKEAILKSSQSNTILESVKDIASFNQLTLKYGIDSVKFEIAWYEDLNLKLINGEELINF